MRPFNNIRMAYLEDMIEHVRVREISSITVSAPSDPSDWDPPDDISGSFKVLTEVSTKNLSEEYKEMAGDCFAIVIFGDYDTGDEGIVPTDPETQWSDEIKERILDWHEDGGPAITSVIYSDESVELVIDSSAIKNQIEQLKATRKKVSERLEREKLVTDPRRLAVNHIGSCEERIRELDERIKKAESDLDKIFI